MIKALYKLEKLAASNNTKNILDTAYRFYQ